MNVFMRVGVDFRILAVGREWMSRGMGRYTQQQLAAALAAGTDDEFVIICPPGADLSLVKDEIRTSPAVAIREWSGGEPDSVSDTGSLLQRGAAYEEWIAETGIDVYHSTTPFQMSEPTMADFTVCPMVATFYDAIPLVFPSQFLEGWAGRDTYMRTLAGLSRAARLIAISESARDDAGLYVGFPPSRIDVAYPVAEPCFRPMAPSEVKRVTADLRMRICVPDRYALTVSHIHHAKNLSTLLRGYALIPQSLRRELPLIVCCHLEAYGIDYVRQIAAGLGIQDDIVLTGLVTDDELAALYNGATVVVHPSRYEGFGLPVIEAMHCGTAVLTTTTSSLPEVAGNAAVLVDPDDPLAFAEGIQELVEDPALRVELAEAGLMQVQRFDLAQLGRATLASYRAAVANEPAGSTTTDVESRVRTRVAVWTPLPPQQTGIADYAVELLNHLRTRCDLEVFVDAGSLPPLDLLRRFRISHFSAFERRNSQSPFDVVLYQMGGSLFHDYMYEPLQRHPGIVVLHELVWSCVLLTRALSAGEGMDAFRRDVEELEGPEGLRAFDELERLSPGLDPEAREVALWNFLYRYPMLVRIVDCSLAQIVPFPTAADELRRRYKRANPHTVPMGVTDPHSRVPGTAALQARARLGVASNTFVIGVFGIVHRFKRLESCIRAVAAFAGEHPDVRLVIVGRALESAYEERLRELASSLGVGDRVLLAGHVDRADFDAHLLAADVVVNLRYPYLAQMSATLMRAIAAGKPIVISDHPDWRFLPADFCMRVAPDTHEVANLTAHLRALAGDAPLRKRMAAAARSYFEREGTVEHMADRYLAVIHSVT